MTARAIQVPIDESTREALVELAIAEDRHPRMQAARLLRDAVHAARPTARRRPAPIDPKETTA